SRLQGCLDTTGRVAGLYIGPAAIAATTVTLPQRRATTRPTVYLSAPVRRSLWVRRWLVDRVPDRRARDTSHRDPGGHRGRDRTGGAFGPSESSPLVPQPADLVPLAHPMPAVQSRTRSNYVLPQAGETSETSVPSVVCDRISRGHRWCVRVRRAG